jgi:hypothetical protein
MKYVILLCLASLVGCATTQQTEQVFTDKEMEDFRISRENYYAGLEAIWEEGVAKAEQTMFESELEGNRQRIKEMERRLKNADNVYDKYRAEYEIQLCGYEPKTIEEWRYRQKHPYSKKFGFFRMQEELRKERKKDPMAFMARERRMEVESINSKYNWGGGGGEK